MKTNMTSRSSKRGFTLVEMIGVLAIIAVLAALLIPRIFQAINEARVNSAALSYNSIKSAAMSHFGKFGRFGNAAGQAYDATTITTGVDDYDLVLLTGGFIEKPFDARIGTDSNVRISPANPATDAVLPGNSAYNLDGIGANNDASAGSMVLEVILTGVSYDDALELNRKIDGENLGEVAWDDDDDAGTPALTGTDLNGRVKYSIPDGTTGEVRIYIAHK